MCFWWTAVADNTTDARRVVVEMEEVALRIRYSIVYNANADGAVVALCRSIFKFVRRPVELVFDGFQSPAVFAVADVPKAEELLQSMGSLFGGVGTIPFGYPFLRVLGFVTSIRNGNVIGKKY